MTVLRRLHDEHDQSPWIDFIDRALIDEGDLERLIERGLRGLTSNPTIFGKAVASGQYDELIRSKLDEGCPTEEIYEAIAIADVGDAADRLRTVFDAGNEADGFVSIEVEPSLANDTARTVERARELWSRLERPNIFVKIPGTPAGLPAITQAISEGINVNVTLLFSVDVYRDVARAYLEGLRQRHARGEDVTGVRSVASFFVSRVDTKIDGRLEELGSERALGLRGKAAVANAKIAYLAFSEIFDGDEFEELRASGAHVQRCLWASTSTKNPEYRDVLYVEELIGPRTVNTMPLDTIEAFEDHGRLERTLDRDIDAAREVLRELDELGISLDQATRELVDEGVDAFAASFDELIETIDSKRKALAGT